MSINKNGFRFLAIGTSLVALVGTAGCAGRRVGRAAHVPPPASAAPVGVSQLSPAEIAERVRRSVVTVHAGDNLGSGFVIAEGVVVTNLHVVGSQERITIATVDRAMYRVGAILGFDADADLALLAVDGKLDLPALPLGDSDQVAQGETIYAFGAPAGLDFTLSTGMLSAIRRSGASTILQMSAPIAPGSSGGPALNDRGEVIGVVTAMHTRAQNVGFAVPVSAVQRLVARKEPKLTLEEFVAKTTPSVGLAGFSLGMSVEQANEVCEGKLARSNNELICPFSPVGVSFAAGDVHLELAEGRVASVRVHATSWETAHAALVERYGAPRGFAKHDGEGWVMADGFDPAAESVALWKADPIEIVVSSTDRKIDVKLFLGGS
jgi:hypothetical protein